MPGTGFFGEGDNPRAGVGLGHHTDAWFEAQNAATGQPRGARHHDLWYQREIARRQGAARKQDDPSVGTPMPPPPPPPGKTQAQIDAEAAAAAATAAQAAAAAETDRQAKMRARRNEWDRLNNQGAYDPDGWQSIGYQPDPVAMPSWWLDGLELGTTAPAVPLPIPPVVAPPVIPPAAAPVSPAPGTNALAQLVGPVAPAPATQAPAAQSWNQPQALAPAGQAPNATRGQAAQGAWGGENLFSGQQPDAGAWGQQPATTKSPGLQSWAQPAGQNLGLWGQKPPKQSKPPGVWGQQPAGTWGAGSL